MGHRHIPWWNESPIFWILSFACFINSSSQSFRILDHFQVAKKVTRVSSISHTPNFREIVDGVSSKVFRFGPFIKP